MRGNMLCPPAPSTNDACQSLNGCGEPIFFDSAAGAAVSGSTPNTLMSGRSALIALPHACDQSAAADAADHRARLRLVLEDLEPDRAVARDEIMIVEGMD